jgi:3-methyladenine DNA glycosylase AlkD
MDFVTDLIKQLKQEANKTQALAMEAYMKQRFPFLGVKAPLRQQILKNLVTAYKTSLDRTTIIAIAKRLYAQPEREFHYCAVELVSRFLKKKILKEDIDFIEYLIVTHSWWDTVDMVCKHHLGNYLKLYPNETEAVIRRYSDLDHLWLNRSAILFQLEYKSDTNQDLLFDLCLKHKDTEAFFINKAIGWALREFSKTAPEHVRHFINMHEFAPLSRTEALRLID